MGQLCVNLEAKCFTLYNIPARWSIPALGFLSTSFPRQNISGSVDRKRFIPLQFLLTEVQILTAMLNKQASGGFPSICYILLYCPSTDPQAGQECVTSLQESITSGTQKQGQLQL